MCKEETQQHTPLRCPWHFFLNTHGDRMSHHHAGLPTWCQPPRVNQKEIKGGCCPPHMLSLNRACPQIYHGTAAEGRPGSQKALGETSCDLLRGWSIVTQSSLSQSHLLHSSQSCRPSTKRLGLKKSTQGLTPLQIPHNSSSYRNGISEPTCSIVLNNTASF